MDYAEQVDFIMPRHKMIHDRSMSYSSSPGPKLEIDNVWLATIAGTLYKHTSYLFLISKHLISNDLRRIN